MLILSSSLLDSLTKTLTLGDVNFDRGRSQKNSCNITALVGVVKITQSAAAASAVATTAAAASAAAAALDKSPRKVDLQLCK